jgi:glycogen debranching enzyme
MKIHTIIVIVILSIACLAATGAPLVRADTSRIESIAMKAIAKRYTNLKSSDLVLESIQYSFKADGSEAITIIYNLPASATHKHTNTGGYDVNITNTPNINLTLSNSGKVTNISKGSSSSYSSSTVK